MASVKIVTNTPKAAQTPQNFADIKGQGKIPYCQLEDVPTPNTAKERAKQKSKETPKDDLPQMKRPKVRPKTIV